MKKELYSFCPQNTVARWCNEKDPVNPDRINNKDTIKALSDFLNVDVDYLLCKQVYERESSEKPSEEQLVRWTEMYSTVMNNYETFELADSLKTFFSKLGYSLTDNATDSTDEHIEYQTIERIDETHFMLLSWICVVPSPIKFEIKVKRGDKTITTLTENEYYQFISSIKAHILTEFELMGKSMAERLTSIQNKEDDTM